MHPFGYPTMTEFRRAWWRSYGGGVWVTCALILFRVLVIPRWVEDSSRAALGEALTFSGAILAGAWVAWGEVRDDRREGADLAFHLGAGGARIFMPPFVFPSLMMMAGVLWCGETLGAFLLGHEDVECYPWNLSWLAGVTGAIGLLGVDRWILGRVSRAGRAPRLPRRAGSRWVPMAVLALAPPTLAIGFRPSVEGIQDALVGLGSSVLVVGLIALWVWSRRSGSDGLPSARG